MFLKFLKHEYKRSYLPCVFISALFIFVCLFLMIMIRLKATFFIGIAAMALGLILMMSTVFVFYNIIKSIYNGLFSKEGYLTLTLPVSAKTIILAKITVNLTYLIVYLISACGGLILIFLSFQNLIEIFENVAKILSNPLLVVVMLVNLIIAITLSLTFFVFLLAFLNSGRFKKNQLLWGIFIYFACTMGYSMISQVFNIIPYSLYYTSEGFMVLKNNGDMSVYFSLEWNFSTLFWNCIAIVGCFFGANKLIKSGIDLK